jgi:SAM-dependent methyltransferase
MVPQPQWGNILFMTETSCTGNDQCRICGHAHQNEIYTAREMMFGLREEFVYFQCSACRCLQIREIPADMTPYYPSNYYSMQVTLPEHGPFRKVRCAIESHIRLGVSNRLFKRHTRNQRIFDWMRGTRTDRDCAILDVGCGRGKLLHELSLFGFSDLTGVDPFIPESMHHDNGIVIHKCELSELNRKFDLIMMHHSFEHLPMPEKTFRDVAARLRPGRMFLLRIPVIDCYPWRQFGVNWLSLDALRHFYLHSELSIGMLAEKTGFEVCQVLYDSGAHQLWGSEQYMRDIPHRSPNSYEDNPQGSIFSKRQIKEFERQSLKLNAARDGDSACFYLRRIV